MCDAVLESNWSGAVQRSVLCSRRLMSCVQFLAAAVLCRVLLRRLTLCLCHVLYSVLLVQQTSAVLRGPCFSLCFVVLGWCCVGIVLSIGDVVISVLYSSIRPPIRKCPINKNILPNKYHGKNIRYSVRT